MNMDVGMHHAKNRANKDIPLAILSRILAQSPPYIIQAKGYASILDSIAKGISLFARFFAWCIPTSIFIQLNDFSTCNIIHPSMNDNRYDSIIFILQ